MNEIINAMSVDGKIEVYKNIYISVERFKSIFKGATKYKDFIEIDKGKKGYKDFFDALKQEGILH